MAKNNVIVEIFGMVVNIPLLFYCLVESGKRDKRTKLMIGIILANLCVLLLDCVGWAMDGKVEYTILLYAVNSGAFCFGYIISTLFTYYLIACIEIRKKINRNFAHVIGGFAIISIILVLVSLYNHMYFSMQSGVYVRGPAYWFSHVFSVTVLMIDMFLVIKYHKLLGWIETISLLSYGVLPLIMIWIQIKIYGLALINLATTLSILIIYIGVHVEQGMQMKKQEAELAEIKVSVLLSQIQPHFIYNSLTAISYLCDKEPQTAKQALLDFAQYMRGNMDSINSGELIPFRKELQHTEKFLKLEKLRYEERLNVVYDIREEMFFCPALTLQLVVENAIKYGICTREDGGEVLIRTESNDESVIITVKDNGIGMDVNSLDEIPIKNDGKTHIGLKNVRYRVRIMTGGDVKLTSKCGVGTTVTITIPKGRENEHYSNR